MVKQGYFLSYWESGAMFRAPCKIDIATRKVFDIMNVGHPGDNDALLSEAVEVSEVEQRVVNIDDIINENDTREAYLLLQQVKRKKQFWYSQEGNDLYEKLAAAEEMI